MLQTNIRQRDFYESRFEATETRTSTAERAANTLTNIWTWMRRRVQSMRKASGVDDELYALHRAWMSNMKDGRVLDLGCFAGNTLSLWIAEKSAEYIGIDLSEQAIQSLNTKLAERKLTHAHAYAQDFLANAYPDNHFDLVYAFSVLHHFKDMSVMLAELHRVLKPGGIIISVDPLMTEPLNYFSRMLYRPLQTDRDWEWPFHRGTFQLIQNYFEIADMQGFLGMSKLGFPFQMLPGLEELGRSVGYWGLKFDKRHARQFGLPFFLCWLVTMKLCKPDKG
jgi:2-polyprenyl-3-methyl-5-hydroxy-6-metoxy-1,4-benzoquinol methylase